MQRSNQIGDKDDSQHEQDKEKDGPE